MAESQTRRLGDVAFLTHDDGSVTRTIINSLGENNTFGLLEHSYRPPYFAFADAVAASITKLKEQEKKIKDTLAIVQANIAAVSSTEYEQQVAAAPLKKVSGSLIGAAFGLDGEAQEMPVPSSYFEPGQTVFCVVTPKTHNMMMPHYRPCAYFVLESTVRTVHLLEGGKVKYDFDSYYTPRAAFLDSEEAKRELVRIFAEETSGELSIENVRLVSHQEEQDAERDSSKKILEQVKRQFERPPID